MLFPEIQIPGQSPQVGLYSSDMTVLRILSFNSNARRTGKLGEGKDGSKLEKAEPGSSRALAGWRISWGDASRTRTTEKIRQT